MSYKYSLIMGKLGNIYEDCYKNSLIRECKT